MKKMENKLASGVRQAKKIQEQAAENVSAHPSASALQPTASALHNDQSPAPSLDNPWKNLHPGRVWPD